MVMKNTSRRYYGWHRPHLGVRMAEWLRPGLWEVLMIKLRGIKPGQILTHKKSIGWADGTEVTSRRYYGWHRPHLGVRMAEWLRPGLWEVLTIKLRGIEPGRILTHKKVHKLGGWY